MAHGLHVPVPPPVAGVPAPELADGATVAHGWLVRLVAGRPLAHAARLPVGALAADGPRLAAAVLRAVGSDAALADLTGLAADAGRLAGATTPAAAAAAATALRDACGATLEPEVPRGDDARAAALAARLTRVGDVLVQAVLREPDETLEERIVSRIAAGAPFAVVAVEVDGAERLLAADRDGTAAAAVRAAQEAMTAAAAPGEVLPGADPGRLWVVAAGDARTLAARLAPAARDAATLDGAPLAARAGIASWPDDGADAVALLERADERVLAALASGVPVAG
jgi:hypothetical protein